MDFETFRENLARDIKETLEARTGTDFEVEHRTAEKVNGNYEAILVKPADGEVGVSLNASNLYRDYESGVSYETIVLGIWGCIAVGILCYLFRDSSPYNARLMAAGIGMGIAAAMNAVFWMLEE